MRYQRFFATGEWLRQRDWRRTVPVLGGVFVCAYAILVVWYAQGIPDVGLLCLFDTRILRVDGQFEAFEATVQRQPLTGDVIRQIGDEPIRTWSDFVSALARLRGGAEDAVRVVFEHDGKNFTCWRKVGKPPAEEFVHSAIWFLLKFSLFFVVAVVYWKRPEDQSVRRFFILCIVTMCAFMGGYHWLRIASSPPLVTIFMVCAVALPVVSLHFYLVFPHPKAFVQRRPFATMGWLYGTFGLTVLALLAAYGAVVWSHRGGYPPETVIWWSKTLKQVIYLTVIIAAFQFLGCLASLGYSYLTTEPGSLPRNQVKWILTGALLATVPLGYVLYLAAFNVDRFGMGGAAWPMFAASLCFTVAYGVSISRYGMMEVTQVLNWGIVTVAVSIATGLAYSGLVFAGTFLIGSQIENLSPFRQAAWVSLTAWLLLLILDAIRWRWRKVVDRQLHRERYQLDKTLRRMGEAVEQLVDPATTCRRLLETLAELLGVTRGAVYLRDDEGTSFRLVARIGSDVSYPESWQFSPLLATLEHGPLVRARAAGSHPGGSAHRELAELGVELALPLKYERTLLAMVLLGPRAVGEYGIEELHLLTTIAHVAALAVHGARVHQTIDVLNRDLKAKVEKISEQQRRIMILQTQLLRQGSASWDHVDQEEVASRPSTDVEQPTLQSDGLVLSRPLVGSSSAVQGLLHVVRKVAQSPSAVLIRGESGTGKELLARALHENSPRAQKPFVQVHCAALSPTLLESELFGHVKGAYTGAHKDKVGRFELAHGGTMFLDEIGDVSLEVQTKLLRVLQEMTFERVGSSEPVKIDVRIIAATHQNLEQLMRAGRFREDLFYRLNVITIQVPPLRDHREDVYEMALHFLKLHSRRSGKTITHVEDEALEALKAYDWPGNVRELENVMERAVVLAEGDTITLADLPSEITAAASASPSTRRSTSPLPATSPVELGLREADWAARQERQEHERLVHALSAAGGNKSKAARALGMPRSTLVSKLEKYGLVKRGGTR